MAEYTYRFANLLSDSDIAELELSDVRFDRRISSPGAFTASITVTNSDIASQVKKITPAKTIVHVFRDADIWGTYIIWSMRVRSSSRQGVQVEFTGATLESWLYRRLLDVDMTFDDVDQFDIARALVSNAQVGWTPYEANADLNIVFDDNDSGVLRDRTYLLTEAASVGQRLDELSKVDNGFEYMIKTYVDTDNDLRVRELVLSERFGTVDDVQNVYTYPGSILAYEANYDATDSATAFWTRGDTISDDVTGDSEPLMITAPVLSDDWLGSAYPHMDKVVNYASVTVLTTLEDYAAWWRDNHAGVIVVPVIEINTSDTTLITPSTLGNYAQFTILDEFFSMGDEGPEFSYINRVIGIEVSPGERGKAESIRFVIEQDVDPTDIGS